MSQMCVGDLRSSLEMVCIMVDVSDVYWGSEELPGGGVHHGRYISCILGI